MSQPQVGDTARMFDPLFDDKQGNCTPRDDDSDIDAGPEDDD
jgi:hypothetical protein